MTERITIEVSWDAPDGTLEDLENEGGDVTLAEAAAEAARAGAGRQRQPGGEMTRARKTTETPRSMAPWVARSWLAYWFSVRHTGCPGYSVSACREIARHYLNVVRDVEGMTT